MRRADTHTSRKVLLNGEPASRELREDPASNPIALITQHTTFLSDLPVRTFLETHARIRGGGDRMGALVGETLEFANELTGEPILEHIRMTELSGGQTRALLVADAAIICNTPSCCSTRWKMPAFIAVAPSSCCGKYRKIFIFVTHDPRIALLSDYRVVMREGSITAVLRTSPVEKTLERVVAKLDDGLAALREKLRVGAQLEGNELEALAVMKVAICAARRRPGKSSVLRHITRRLLPLGKKPAFLKIDVQYAEEDTQFAEEFGIRRRRKSIRGIVSRHCNVMVLGDAIKWADRCGCDVLLVETAGLCLRCSPYADGAFGMIVLEATSGMEPSLEGRADALAGRCRGSHEDRSCSRRRSVRYSARGFRMSRRR